MYRVNENKKLLNSMPQELTGSGDDIRNRLLAMIYRVLADISKSQAIIADNAKQEIKARKQAARAARDNSEVRP